MGILKFVAGYQPVVIAHIGDDYRHIMLQIVHRAVKQSDLVC